MNFFGYVFKCFLKHFTYFAFTLSARVYLTHMYKNTDYLFIFSFIHFRGQWPFSMYEMVFQKLSTNL